MNEDDKTVEEVWESQVPGRTFAETRDYENRPRNVSCVGVGGRLRLTTADRIRTQERIVSVKLDPFRNGTLLRIDKSQQDDPETASKDAQSDEDLRAVFDLDDLDDFREYVGELSEINIRRLKVLAPDADANVNQSRYLDELIEERFAIGGDTPTWRETNAAPSGGA